MAYILDKKIVKDTEEFSNSAYGITLPIQPGMEVLCLTKHFPRLKHAKSNLKNLLLTNKGERPFSTKFWNWSCMLYCLNHS